MCVCSIILHNLYLPPFYFFSSKFFDSSDPLANVKFYSHIFLSPLLSFSPLILFPLLSLVSSIFSFYLLIHCSFYHCLLLHIFNFIECCLLLLFRNVCNRHKKANIDRKLCLQITDVRLILQSDFSHSSSENWLRSRVNPGQLVRSHFLNKEEEYKKINKLT